MPMNLHSIILLLPLKHYNTDITHNSLYLYVIRLIRWRTGMPRIKIMQYLKWVFLERSCWQAVEHWTFYEKYWPACGLKKFPFLIIVNSSLLLSVIIYRNKPFTYVEDASFDSDLRNKTIVSYDIWIDLKISVWGSLRIISKELRY